MARLGPTQTRVRILALHFLKSMTNPVRRLGLHAWKLEFDHPITGQRLELESPLPKDLKRVVSSTEDGQK